MFTKKLSGKILNGLFMPGLAILLASTFALAEGVDNQQALSPGDQTTAAPSGAVPESAVGQGVDAPAPEMNTEAEVLPGVPEKHRKAKKVKKELDPVSEGKKLFETRCSTCHAVPNTNVHTMAEWPECIRRMAARSYLRDADVAMIVQYLEHELTPAAQPEN